MIAIGGGAPSLLGFIVQTSGWFNDHLKRRFPESWGYPPMTKDGLVHRKPESKIDDLELALFGNPQMGMNS